MTTIVYDGLSAAADKQLSYGNLVRTTTKLFRHGDNIIAYEGYYSDCAMIHDWILGGMVKDQYPKDIHENARLYVFIKDKPTLVFNTHPTPTQVEDVPMCAGSGGDVALGALAKGATAVEAVKIAARYDSATGDEVDVFFLP